MLLLLQISLISLIRSVIFFTIVMATLHAPDCYGGGRQQLLRKLFTFFPMSSLPKQFILFDSKRSNFSCTLFNSLKGSVFLDKFVKQLVAGGTDSCQT